MTETDTDAMLLDNIEGKYGDGSDCDDLVNADEDALLADDDADFLTINHTHLYDDTIEELDHEPEEGDSEDVLDLETQDVELEDDVEEKNAVILDSNNKGEVDRPTLIDSNSKEREDKFKNERDIPSKCNRIPDSLDKVEVVSSVPSVRNNSKRNSNHYKNRGRGGYHGNRNAQNQIVLINPHFKGHVKINHNSRLAWDARQRIHKNNQAGKMSPFIQNKNVNQNGGPIQIWNHINHDNVRISTPNNVPQFQQQLPVFQPPPLQPPVWNQYQPDAFNEVPPQQLPISNQLVFMQPIPQNVYSNQQIQPQFNQPPPQLANYNNTPNVYPNAMQNTFTNNQFFPPPNQFNQPFEPYMNYPNLQQNQYPNVNNIQCNQETVFFNNNNRGISQKPNFAHPQKVNRRKLEGLEIKKKKRNLTSTNLHEVRTVDRNSTVQNQEKLIKQEQEEDEETRQYRLKIEEQKRKREEILRLKEERRLKAIQNGTVDDTTYTATSPEKPTVPQTITQNVRPRQPARTGTGLIRIQQQTSNVRDQLWNSSVNINTDSDDSKYDKQHLASFLANRKILAKDQSLIDTSIVVMKNLSAGTTEIKLRKMCQGIGDIKKLQMSLKERQATIQFSSVASAHAFFKKYQRTMLDLSMIQVSLIPMS